MTEFSVKILPPAILGHKIVKMAIPESVSWYNEGPPF